MDGSSAIEFGEVLHFFEESGVAFVVPLLQFDAFLHLFEGFPEHARELDRHILHLLLEIIEFLLLLLQFLLVICPCVLEYFLAAAWVGQVVRIYASLSSSYLRFSSTFFLSSISVASYCSVILLLHGGRVTRFLVVCPFLS